MEVPATLITGILAAGYPILLAVLGFIIKRDREETVEHRKRVDQRLRRIELNVERIMTRMSMRQNHEEEEEA